jgi:hypothetical protein
MIDFENESLISFSQAGQLLSVPKHRATITRWADGLGVRGIVLESVRVGGRRYTTAPALARFVEKCQSIGSFEQISPETQARLLEAKAKIENGFPSGADGADDEFSTGKKPMRHDKPGGQRHRKH